MKNKHLLFSVAVIAISMSWLFTACNKSESASVPPGQQSATLYMTDGPGIFDKVFLDVTSVEVLVDTSKNTRMHDGFDWDDIGRRNHQPDSALVWQNLNATAGVYNLLQLKNGVDTLLASANIKAGAIRLIRIDLGTNNSLVKDSVTYPLNLVPGLPSYVLIKLQGNEWERTGSSSFRLWLDFDVQRSIIKVRDNAFYLSPVIRAFIVSRSGTVTGTLLPRDAWPEVVSLFNSTDTAYAITNRDGMFMIRGLKDGTYSAFFNASNGYRDTTISNITISNASKVSLGGITLHK